MNNPLMPVSPTRPIAPWLGGKRNLAKRLCALIEGDYGKALFNRDRFEEMAQVLRAIKGRFILSLNDRLEVRETFAGFAVTEVKTSYSIASKGVLADRAELLISNFPSICREEKPVRTQKLN